MAWALEDRRVFLAFFCCVCGRSLTVPSVDTRIITRPSRGYEFTGRRLELTPESQEFHLGHSCQAAVLARARGASIGKRRPAPRRRRRRSVLREPRRNKTASGATTACSPAACSTTSMSTARPRSGARGGARNIAPKDTIATAATDRIRNQFLPARHRCDTRTNVCYTSPSTP